MFGRGRQKTAAFLLFTNLMHTRGIDTRKICVCYGLLNLGWSGLLQSFENSDNTQFIHSKQTQFKIWENNGNLVPCCEIAI